MKALDVGEFLAMVSIVECVKRAGRAPEDRRPGSDGPFPEGPPPADVGGTLALLRSVRRYTIHCTGDGVTVGLVVRTDGGDRYGESTSESGDLPAAVREAFARAAGRC
jgi:hypothetical protein